ncbi:DUF7220 family protein [Puniceibacterium confluentis]|uniref:DUF7220 family protein n=1 Tax=Puniceibacterium confluentis TaxID=1958944 RepID=UPI00356133AA
MQSRSMSALEALANVTVGWLVAFVTQVWIFPVIGLQATLDQHLLLSSAFTTVSLIRSYVLRRGFAVMERSGADGGRP